MTELIGTHEVPCLSDTDYAAYALHMRCLAEKVEDQLIANREAADAALHRAVRVWSFSDSFGQGGGGSSGSVAGGALFSVNYPAVFTDTTLCTLNLRGWWRVGMLLRAVSNTPVLNNNRLASLAVYPPGLSASLRTFESGAWALKLQDITWESNTGNGETLYTSGEVYNPGDPSVGPDDLGMRIRYALSVEGSGSETVAFTGNFWAIYLGDTPSIDI